MTPGAVLFAHTVRHHRLRISSHVFPCGREWLTSREWTFVLKLLSLTCSTFPLSIRCGSASSHVAGIATSGESFVYANKVNVPVCQNDIRSAHHSSARGVKRRHDQTAQKARINSHSSSRIGRNVTLDVICFIISLISPWTSFSVFWCFFAGLPPGSGVFADGFEGSSVCMSNCHRSRVSSVSTDLIARTRRLIDDDSSHSACQLCSRVQSYRACLRACRHDQSGTDDGN